MRHVSGPVHVRAIAAQVALLATLGDLGVLDAKSATVCRYEVGPEKLPVGLFVSPNDYIAGNQCHFAALRRNKKVVRLQDD